MSHIWTEQTSSDRITTDSAESVLTTAEWDGIKGSQGVAGIMAFGGAMFDPSDSTINVWGGGHSDYKGNDWHRFSISAETWLRRNLPSTADQGATEGDPLQDGTPNPRHLYGCVGRLNNGKYLVGGQFTSPNALSQGGYWTFDPSIASRTSAILGWAQIASPPQSFGWLGDYDTTNDRFIQVAREGIQEWDVATNTWQQRNIYTGSHPDVEGSKDRINGATLSTALRESDSKVLVIGSGETPKIWTCSDASASNWPRSEPTFTGDTAILSSKAPGLVWNSTKGLFEAFHPNVSATNIYEIDIDNFTVTAVAAAPESTATPNQPRDEGGGNGGVYTRFVRDDTNDKNYYFAGGSNDKVYTMSQPSVGAVVQVTRLRAGAIAGAYYAPSNDTVISATTQSLALTANAVTISASKSIDATTEGLTLTSYQAAIALGTNIQAALESLTLTSNSAQIFKATNIGAGIESLSVSGNQATIELTSNDVDILAALESIGINTNSAVVSGVQVTWQIQVSAVSNWEIQ